MSLIELEHEDKVPYGESRKVDAIVLSGNRRAKKVRVIIAAMKLNQKCVDGRRG